MEGGKLAFASPSSLKPIPEEFPAGLRVLVVDDDPICLKIIEKMLTTCKYKVTTCTKAVVALSFLNDSEDGFDLVLSDVYMPDMNGFELLENIGLKMDLPVIMMSADDKLEVVMQGVIHGACDYLIKPVRMENIKNIWQHVLRKKRHEFKDLEPSVSADDSDKLKKVLDDGDYASSEASWKFSKRKKDVKDEEDEGEDREDSSSLKKPRVVWSVDLHQQFVSAVNQLGIDKAVPKKILELMNVQGLTRENVASHLQKYRLYLRRINMENQSGVSDSFGGPSESNYSSVTSLEDLDLQALASSAHLLQHNFVSSQSDAGKGTVPNNIGTAFPGHLNAFNYSQALMRSAKLKFGNPPLLNNQLGLHQVIPSSLEMKQLPQLHQAISTPFGSVNFRSRDGLSGLPNLPSQIIKQFPVVESTMPGPTRITGQFANEFGFSPTIGRQMLPCNVSDLGKHGPPMNGRSLSCDSYMPVHGADFLINSGPMLPPTNNFSITNGDKLSEIPSTKDMEDLRNEAYHRDTTLLPNYDVFNGQNIAAGGTQNTSLSVNGDIEAGLHALEEPTKSEQTGNDYAVQGNSQAQSTVSAEAPSVLKVEPSSNSGHGTMLFTEQTFGDVPFHAFYGQQESGGTADHEFNFDEFTLESTELSLLHCWKEVARGAS